MKYLISIFCIWSSLAAQNQSQPPVAIYISSSPTAIAQGVQSITTITHQPLLQAIKPNVSLLYDLMRSYIKEHCFFLSCIGIFSLYSALLFFLFNEHYALHTSYCWGVWRKNETFEQLCAQPHETLKIQLIKDIAAYYVNPQNPTDTMWPLSHFINATKKEEARLKHYIYVAKVLKKTPLLSILPTLQEEYAQEVLARLQFVYHIFTAWSADLTWEALTHRIG